MVLGTHCWLECIFFSILNSYFLFFFNERQGDKALGNQVAESVTVYPSMPILCPSLLCPEPMQVNLLHFITQIIKLMLWNKPPCVRKHSGLEPQESCHVIASVGLEPRSSSVG